MEYGEGNASILETEIRLNIPAYGACLNILIIIISINDREKIFLERGRMCHVAFYPGLH